MLDSFSFLIVIVFVQLRVKYLTFIYVSELRKQFRSILINHFWQSVRLWKSLYEAWLVIGTLCLLRWWIWFRFCTHNFCWNIYNLQLQRANFKLYAFWIAKKIATYCLLLLKNVLSVYRWYYYTSRSFIVISTAISSRCFWKTCLVIPSLKLHVA